MTINPTGFEILKDLNIASIIFRIFLSVLVGGILGIERGSKNRPAGFRTYILVCLGAALVMMTNQYIFKEYNASDPSRLGAQVISGIGFIGAGTIILNGRNQVKGVTTAACLWTAACCGLAIGVGFYSGALIGAIAILFVLMILTNLPRTLLMTALIWAPVMVSLLNLSLFVQATPGWLLIYYSAAFYLCTMLIQKPFRAIEDHFLSSEASVSNAECSQT